MYLSTTEWRTLANNMFRNCARPTSNLQPLFISWKSRQFFQKWNNVFSSSKVLTFWCRIHLWFRLMGSARKVDEVTAWASRRNMADMRYYGNVITTKRWRLCVTMATLWQQKDGGYALLWKRYDVTCYRCILHLQQYSRRLNLLCVFFYLFSSFV
jgi:hypothetical protein